MTDLEAIIQAAEETRADAYAFARTPAPNGPNSDDSYKAAIYDVGVFDIFIAKLKALRQGIYG
jgi:hypothetical protein